MYFLMFFPLRNSMSLASLNVTEPDYLITDRCWSVKTSAWLNTYEKKEFVPWKVVKYFLNMKSSSTL